MRAVEDLLSEEPNYEGALCVWALGEAGADAASLQGTSYAAGDGAAATAGMLWASIDVSS